MATFGFDVPVQETVFYKQVKQEGRAEGRAECLSELAQVLSKLKADPDLIAKTLEHLHKPR